MIKNLLATVAAAGLVFAPIAAQAGTRAADAGVSTNALASLERAPSPLGTGEAMGDDGDVPLWLLILLFAGVGAGIIAATDSSENNKSPGT